MEPLSEQSIDHSHLLVSAESPVTAPFSWVLPVGRREDFRGGKAQDWGTREGQGKLLGRLGLGVSLKGGEAFVWREKKGS